MERACPLRNGSMISLNFWPSMQGRFFQENRSMKKSGGLIPTAIPQPLSNGSKESGQNLPPPHQAAGIFKLSGESDINGTKPMTKEEN